MEEERKALQNMILESIRLGYTPHLLLNNTMNKLEEILAEFTKNFVCTDSDEEGNWEYIPDAAAKLLIWCVKNNYVTL